MLAAIITSLVLSASGDPYARCAIEDSCGLRDIELSSGQKTALVNHITSQPEWSGITPSTITEFECEIDISPVRCRPWYNIVVTDGGDIQAVLAALGEWKPGIDSNSYLLPGPWKYYTGTNETTAKNHIYNVAANQQSIAGLPLKQYRAKRTNGSGILHADIGYKAEATEAWCWDHRNETIIKDGVVP